MVTNSKPSLRDDQGDPCIVMDSKVSLSRKCKVASDLLSGSASQTVPADISERLGKS